MKHVKKRYFAKSFASLDAFAGYLDEAPVTDLFRGREASIKGTKKFTTTETLEEASSLLRFGDVKNARRLVAGVAVPGSNVAESIRARRVRCIAGSSVNVPAALAGRPKSMYKIVRCRVPAKVLNLAYNQNIDYTIPASEIVAVAVRLANVVLSLEKAGYQVNLYSAVCVYKGAEAVGCFVRVKSAGQYLDVTRLAYCLVNPSFLRRSVFRFIETLPGLTEDGWPGSYGCVSISEEDVASLARAAGLGAASRVLSFYDVRRLDEAGIAAAVLAV